jgi:hypothetical protein
LILYYITIPGFAILGVGPRDLKGNDIFVVFTGCKDPLFFRPQNGRYQVLGDGYDEEFREDLKKGDDPVVIELV